MTSTTNPAPHPTAPLPPAAADALHRLERAFRPAPTVLMSFPTASAATVTVESVDAGRTPYSWTCSAGHTGDESYAVLSFCRDDAKAHAAECRDVPLKVMAAQHGTAVIRAKALAGVADSGLRLSDLDADSLAHAVDLLAGAPAILAARSR